MLLHLNEFLVHFWREVYNSKSLFIIHRTFWICGGCGIFSYVFSIGFQTTNREAVIWNRDRHRTENSNSSQLLLGITCHFYLCSIGQRNINHVSEKQQGFISHSFSHWLQISFGSPPCVLSILGSWQKEQPLAETCSRSLL